MTVPPSASQTPRKPWIDKARKELDRVMERERQLLVAMREDRRRELDDCLKKNLAADCMHGKHAVG